METLPPRVIEFGRSGILGKKGYTTVIRRVALLSGLGLLAVGSSNPFAGAARPMVDVKAECKTQTGGADAEYPGFALDVTYSENATKLLIEKKETVIAAAYLSAAPKPGALKKYVDPIGEVGLGECTVEAAPDESLRFGEILLDKAALAQSDGKPQLLINVFSGRKSSENNLLDCGIFEGDLKPVQGKSLPIACKLIGEP
jgi:hypothetical protein